MINPLILGSIRDSPGKIVRSSLLIAFETGVLLARIGVVNPSEIPLTQAQTMIAHWIAGLLSFVFWAGFAMAVLQRYVEVCERSSEFGMLRVFGASYKYFLVFVVQETLLAALPAAVIAIAFAYLLSGSFSYVSNGLITIAVPYLYLPVAVFLSCAAPLAGATFGIPKSIREGVVQAL